MTVHCSRCGLISHEQIPTDAELTRYYGETYRTDYHGEFTPSAFRILRAWESGQWLLGQLQPYLRPNDRVLEIGAGIGCNVKVLEQAGFRSEGIEPHVGFQGFAERTLRAKVRRQALEDLNREPTYHFIILAHVIEHLNRPLAALCHIHDLLLPGGRLYLECPNVMAPHATPGRLFHYAHIYNFTPSTLRQMAEQAGLRLIEQPSTTACRVIRLLLERPTRPVPLPSPRYEPGHSLEGIRRYNVFRYHLRPSYLRERIARDGRFFRQRITARTRLPALLKQLQTPPADQQQRPAA